jgi:UDP-glucose 4-epimerase
VREIVRDESNYNMIFNVANTDNYSIMNIVESIESIVSKKAVYEISERGEEYAIDVHKTIQWFESAGMSFDDQYLSRTIRKYYGKK